VLTLIAKLTVKAGHEEEFARTMRLVVPKVREEPGNHAYVCHRASDNPRLFMVYGVYADQEALEAHRAHLRDMGIDLRVMLDGAPQLECYETLL
jgi:quinol monooxygenase YgiN